MESCASAAHSNTQCWSPPCPCSRRRVGQAFHRARNTAAQMRGGTRPRRCCRKAMAQRTKTRGKSGRRQWRNLCLMRGSKAMQVAAGSEAKTVFWKHLCMRRDCSLVQGRASLSMMRSSMPAGVMPNCSRCLAFSSNCCQKLRRNQSAQQPIRAISVEALRK